MTMQPDTRSALEAWIREAEELLDAQRVKSISPSFADAVASDVPFESTLTLGTLELGLCAMVERLVADPGRWILILEFGVHEADYFSQFLVFEDGSLAAETVSNSCLEGPHTLTDEQGQELEALGWSPPVPRRRPNWLKVEETRHPDVQTHVDRVLRTLRTVFNVQTEDPVRCKLFSSPARGRTPASEQVGFHDPIEEQPRPRSSGTYGQLRVSGNVRHPRAVDVDELAAGATRAWLIASGLANEIKDLWHLDSEIEVGLPGFSELMDRAEGASIGAHEAADDALRAIDSSDWSRFEDESEFTQNFTEQAERSARQIARLVLGVSACHPSSTVVESAYRAAVAVLAPRSGLRRPGVEDLELFASKPSELLLEIAGLICAVLTTGPSPSGLDRCRSGAMDKTKCGCRSTAKWNVAPGRPPYMYRSSRRSLWTPSSTLARLCRLQSALCPRAERDCGSADARPVGRIRLWILFTGCPRTICSKRPSEARWPLGDALSSLPRPVMPVVPVTGATARSVQCVKFEVLHAPKVTQLSI
jgi:hypothetical protein